MRHIISPCDLARRACRRRRLDETQLHKALNVSPTPIYPLLNGSLRFNTLIFEKVAFLRHHAHPLHLYGQQTGLPSGRARFMAVSAVSSAICSHLYGRAHGISITPSHLYGGTIHQSDVLFIRNSSGPLYEKPPSGGVSINLSRPHFPRSGPAAGGLMGFPSAPSCGIIGISGGTGRVSTR